MFDATFVIKCIFGYMFGYIFGYLMYIWVYVQLFKVYLGICLLWCYWPG